ncbi:MAG: endonuclease domain-containing protein [Ignavibacteriales bacterium]|nr:endonuclease domain-containing protein [Ignavibacteriales bacterium]
MTRVFNRKKDQEKRRFLRRNMTKAEVVLWSKLKNRQLLGERFLRQYGVDQYVLDFYCPRLRIAIEVDGDSHFAIGAREYDEQREQHIGTYGIHFLRFTNVDIYNNLDGVLLSILQLVEEQEKHLPNLGLLIRTPLDPTFVEGGKSHKGGSSKNDESIEKVKIAHSEFRATN